MRWARRAAVTTWPLVQITAAATVAWILAQALGEHDDPFFAPIAAIVALSSPLGERGRNALRLLQGVLIGIAAGELTLWAFGSGYGRLALATFAATLVARALGGSRLVIVQSAAGAVLTVASAGGDAGFDRLLDALVGAGVALVGSQFLFSPEPVALVRRAETNALLTMARALDLMADALGSEDAGRSSRSLAELRTLRDDLAELARLRTAGPHVARHSVVWRYRRTPTVEETENAGQLDLLGVSCLTLARTAMAIGPDERGAVVPCLRELAGILRPVGEDPGDRRTRQDAADRALRLAAEVHPLVADGSPALSAAAMALRLALGDLLEFAGVPAADARRVLDEGTGEVDVRQPPSTPRLRLPRARRPDGPDGPDGPEE